MELYWLVHPHFQFSFPLLSKDYSHLYSQGLIKAVEVVMLNSTESKACLGVSVHLFISGDLVYICVLSLRSLVNSVQSLFLLPWQTERALDIPYSEVILVSHGRGAIAAADWVALCLHCALFYQCYICHFHEQENSPLLDRGTHRLYYVFIILLWGKALTDHSTD